MLRKDLSLILEIERLSFEQPYSREIFEQELKIKAAEIWVATYRKKIVGYLDFWVVRDEMELVSIAVHHKYKHRGVAQLLMQKMVGVAYLKEVRYISLDVRVSNHAAQKLYTKFGFRKVGLRKRYYSDRGEDAVMMRKRFE